MARRKERKQLISTRPAGTRESGDGEGGKREWQMVIEARSEITCTIRENGKRCPNKSAHWCFIDAGPGKVLFKGHICNRHFEEKIAGWDAKQLEGRIEQIKALKAAGRF